MGGPANPQWILGSAFAARLTASAPSAEDVAIHIRHPHAFKEFNSGFAVLYGSCGVAEFYMC